MSKAVLHETMQQIEKKINRNPEPISGTNPMYHFETDREVIQLQLRDGNVEVLRDALSSLQCMLVMSHDNFHKFISGKLNGITVYMMKALKLENIVKQYQLDI